MAARHRKITQAGIATTEALMDAEWALGRIRQALADGLQPHDVPEILGAVAAVEENAAEVRRQMKVVESTVEHDIRLACRILNVGWEELWDERTTAETRRLVEIEQAPTRLHQVEARGDVA